MPEAPLPQAGSRLAQYELIRQVGMGGMGVVFLARDLDLRRDVALKVLRAEVTDNDPTRSHERFLREAQSAARLNHPNVATVYQIGRHEGVTFIAMEWMEGGSLSDHLRQSIFLDWREATAAIRDAAAGLAAAHAAGVIHRDIKPSNLMRTKTGSVKVVDFGLARLHDTQSDLTHSGAVVGTPSYISPEQCRGEAATAASDVYSLVCTYFHLLTSRPPFTAANPLGLIHQHCNEPFPDARKFAEDVPEGVCALIARGSQKEPSRRYVNAADLLIDLDAILAGREATIVTSPVAGSLAEVPTNLVVPSTSFVGREKEIREIGEALSQSRLVTLLGPGGIGKTRLSIHSADQVKADFPGGIWLVELAALNSGERIPQAIAEVLSVRESCDEPLIDAVVARLKPLKTLLLLDNCEHLSDAVAGMAAEILAACPQLRLLATSRQPLGCEEELAVRVAPLESPSAVQLFTDRAARARKGFSISEQNAADVTRICQRLDGIPLAIELAAARVAVLTPKQIVERLDDAFRLLTTGSKHSLPRQQTLRALIDWSYQLLSDAEKAAFARLSVFAGGCTMESAEAIVGGDGVEPTAVLDLVTELVNKSLLVVEESAGATRLRMLETIRQYAIEKLDDATRQRHLEHFTALAEQAATEIKGRRQAEFLARMDAEHDNVRAALDFAGTSEAAMRLAIAVAEYWLMRGKVSEGLSRLEKLIAAAPPGDSMVLGRVLNAAGRLSVYRGELAKAREYHHRALVMARAVGDRMTVAITINNLGTMDMESGDLAAAVRQHEQSLSMFRELGDKFRVAGLLNNLGVTAKQQNDAPKARKLLEESLAIHKELGNATWVAYVYQNLGELEQEQGNSDAGRRFFESSIEILKSLGDEWGVAYAMDGIGKCALQQDDVATARRCFEETLATLKKIGDKSASADVYDDLAQVWIRLGDFEKAAALAGEGFTIRRDLNDLPGLAQSMETLAAARATRDAALAARLLGAADKLRRETNVPVRPVNRAPYESLRSDLITALGDEGFEGHFSSGRSLDLNDPRLTA